MDRGLGRMLIRDATEADVPGILEIYNEVIANTTAVYAEEPVTLDDRLAWMRGRHARGFPVIVAMDGGDVAGFASFGEFRSSPCYRNTVEHTVHVRADRRKLGIGRALLMALIPRAVAMGKHVIIGGIDSSNHGSMELHRRLGFVEVARFREVGRKFDRWLDLVFMQRILDGGDRP